MKLRTFFITLIILLILLVSTLTIVIKTATSSGFFDSILAKFEPDPESFIDDILVDDESYEENETDDELRNIHIDVDALAIRIVPGDEFDVSFYGDDKLEPEIYFAGDCLNIIQNNDSKVIGANDSPKLTITLGQFMYMENVDIESDIGDVFIDDLFIDNIRINAELGNINLHAVNFLNCDINADLGNIIIEDSGAYNSLNIDADFGNIEIHNLYGIDDAGIDAKCEIGSLKIHTDKFDHTGRSFHSESDGPEITINAEVGNIDID